MLAPIQDEQGHARRERGDEAVDACGLPAWGPDRSEPGQHGVDVGARLEIGPHDAVREAARHVPRDLPRQAGLPRSAEPGQAEQPRRGE